MKNRLTGVMAIVMLLIVGLLAPASATSGNAAEVCPEGDSGKIDTTGDPESVSVTAPDGKLISEFCVKAGSEQSNAGVEHVVIDPPSASVVISHTSGKDVSHYSVFYVDAPDEPEVDYCDPAQRPAGMSIADWLPDGFDKQSCFEVVPVLQCGFFDATVTGPFPGYDMVFLRGGGRTTSLDWMTLPATPEEDAGDGSVDITVYLVGPEKDYLVGSGLPNYWDDNGRTVTIDTDCEPPVEVDYCDPSQRPAGLSIADWLPDGFDMQSCFEVTPTLACGSFDATVTGPYPGYEMVYLEGTGMTTSLTWETLPAMFAEDYNGGSVDITVYLVGPEKDYLVGSGLPNYWDDNGRTVTIDTDCEPPVVVDDSFTITLMKQWFDVDGEPVDAPDGVDWSVGLYTSVVTDGEVVDTTQASLPGDDNEFVVADGEPVRYGVEEDLPEGWEVADCDSLDLATLGINYDESGLRTSNEPPVSEDTMHLVCNQQIEVEVLPVVIEAEPEAEPVVVVEREVVEVLGVTATRAVPTGIDSGTGGYLPSSTPPAALLMLLMFGGLVLTGGAAASLVRRRG